MGKMTSFPSEIAAIVKKLFNIRSTIPELVQIEITNICNLNCRMCVRSFIRLPNKHMNYQLFTQVIDRLVGVKKVTLTGYGEPLLHPQIIDAIMYCKKQGLEVSITSNALLLKSADFRRELLSSGLDSISFSMESIEGNPEYGHDNQEALGPIASFIKEKKEGKGQKPFITLQTLMIKDKSQDLFDIVEWGAKNGVDKVNVARFDLNTLGDIARPDENEERRIFQQFDRYRKLYDLRIDCFQDTVFSGLAGKFYKYGKGLLRLDKRCVRLLDFSYINIDGYIRPCCALVNNSMGKITEKSLREIWDSKKYKTFRKNYSKVHWCKKCDVFTLRQKG